MKLRYCCPILVVSLITSVGLAKTQAQSKKHQPPRPNRESAKADSEKNRRAALRAYALGKQKLRQDRLLEALQAFEKAARLDPSSAAVHKALVPMYSALARDEDALAACQKVLALNPNDAETWYAAARIHRRMGERKMSHGALEKGLKVVQEDRQLELALQMHLDLGRLRQDAKKEAEAIRSYDHAVQLLQKIVKNASLEPAKQREAVLRLAAVYERIGKMHADAGRVKDAVIAYQKAQQVDPENATRLSLSLARLQLTHGDLPAAERSLHNYLRLRPQTMEAYRLKIKMLDSSNRSGNVLPWLVTCAAGDRFNERLQMLLAEQYAKRKRTAQAEQIYRKLANENPKIETYQSLFQIYARQPFGSKKILRALDDKIEKANKKDALLISAPAKAQARAMIGALRRENKLAESVLLSALPRSFRDGLQYETIQVLAVLADKQRNPKRAEQYWRDLARRAKRGSEGLAYSGLLRALWKQKRIAEVVKVCNDGLRNSRATNHVLFHSELARAYARLEKYDESLRETEEAIRLASESNVIPMHRLKLHILIQSGKHGAAEKEGIALLRKFKKPADIQKIRAALSSVYSAMKNFKKAEEQLQLVLKIDPMNATACNDLGYLWADRGIKLPEAESMIRKAIELDRDRRQTFVSANNDTDEDRAAYIDSLGWVLFRRGKIKEAKIELERATGLPGGDDPVIWDHLGDVYFRLQNQQKAMKCWRKALELYEELAVRPRDDRYRDLQQKIKQLEKAQP